MLQKSFLIESDVFQGCAAPMASPADHRIARDPEIVWLADVQPVAPDGDVRSIPEMLDEVEAALSRFDLDLARDVCWQAWSLSRDAGALELADGAKLLALALDSNAQLCGGARADLNMLLESTRAYFDDTVAARDQAVSRAA